MGHELCDTELAVGIFDYSVFLSTAVWYPKTLLLRPMKPFVFSTGAGSSRIHEVSGLTSIAHEQAMIEILKPQNNGSPASIRRKRKE